MDDLLGEELRACDAGVQRSVWLCVGILPDLRGDWGWWARSDWAPWVRVVHPDSRLVREYWLLRQLWRVLPDDAEDRPGPLTDLFIRKAKLLPTREVERVRRRCRRNDPGCDWARDRFWTWGNIVAEDLFDRHADEDRGVASRSPMRWSGLTAERSCLALAEPWPLRDAGGQAAGRRPARSGPGR